MHGYCVAIGQRSDDSGQLKVHRRDIGLGAYFKVYLTEARAKAGELKAQIRITIDPIRLKQEKPSDLRIH